MAGEQETFEYNGITYFNVTVNVFGMLYSHKMFGTNIRRNEITNPELLKLYYAKKPFGVCYRGIRLEL